ncbi:uncharacterized protein LOC123538672 [Mercenaria mercenaria]|uniref:uncharacterized protein LOC123538672 n=1 Tax=Mercenaria mercenaria TaxID=6596 RepID=UPI00234F2F65|nr:uncharacterized protein LOC123538672 [Mercenaria mercenaria]
MPTIVVHVWRPDASHVGHCALDLGDGTYISWWPESQCDAKNPRARAVANTSHSIDIEGEGGRQPNSYRIHVSDGELNAIKRWWRGFKDKADYQIVSNNCSTVAYYAQEAAFPFLEVLNDEVDVWVPKAIEMVAEDLASGKRTFDQKRIKEIKEAAHAEAKRVAGRFKGMFVKSSTTGIAGRK